MELATVQQCLLSNTRVNTGKPVCQRVGRSPAGLDSRACPQFEGYVPQWMYPNSRELASTHLLPSPKSTKGVSWRWRYSIFCNIFFRKCWDLCRNCRARGARLCVILDAIATRYEWL